MIMTFTVELAVHVDVDGWTAEYSNDCAADSLRQIFADLREPDQYLTSRQWKGLARVSGVKAQVSLFTPEQLDAMANVIREDKS